MLADAFRLSFSVFIIIKGARPSCSISSTKYKNWIVLFNRGMIYITLEDSIFLNLLFSYRQRAASYNTKNAGRHGTSTRKGKTENHNRKIV